MTELEEFKRRTQDKLRPREFLIWLDGFVDGKDSLSNEDLAKIMEKREEVTEEASPQYIPYPVYPQPALPNPYYYDPYYARPTTTPLWYTTCSGDLTQVQN